VPQTLSDTVIKSIKPPETGTSTMWDGSLAGFGVRCSAGGTKSFIVLIGSGRRQSIGRYPLISLSIARTEAKRLLAEKTLGKVRPTHYAFEDAVTEFLKAKDEKNKPKTVYEYKRLLNRHFDYGRTSIASVQSREFQKRLAAIDAVQERRAAFTAARAFFGWCVRKHIVDKSPLENAAPVVLSKPRDRILTDEELVKVWTAAGECGQFGIIVRLLLLTGQRRGEIGALRKEWICDDKITLPKEITKNGREHTFPIGSASKALVSASSVPKFDQARFLFPARSQPTKKSATTFNGWSKSKAALDEKAKTDAWTLHDLRRTFATNLQRLGIKLEVIEALLNHVSGTRSGIVGVYQRHNFWDEMCAAVGRYEAWFRETILKIEDL
jgi:integrase